MHKGLKTGPILFYFESFLWPVLKYYHDNKHMFYLTILWPEYYFATVFPPKNSLGAPQGRKKSARAQNLKLLLSQPESARAIKSHPKSARVSKSQPEYARVIQSFRFLGAPGGPLMYFFRGNWFKLLLLLQNRHMKHIPVFMVSIRKRSQKWFKLELFMTIFWHNMQPEKLDPYFYRQITVELLLFEFYTVSMYLII